MTDSDLAPFAAVVIGVPDPEIVELEARIRAAQLRADVSALDALLADDLLFTGPDGTVGAKAEDLAAHQSGTVRFREHVPLELRVRRIALDVAITSVRAQLTVEVAGTLTSGEYRYTRVWAREGSHDWRVVGGHVSAVPQRVAINQGG
jgi:ketosteroid isomerase-like protein